MGFGHWSSKGFWFDGFHNYYGFWVLIIQVDNKHPFTMSTLKSRKHSPDIYTYIENPVCRFRFIAAKEAHLKLKDKTQCFIGWTEDLERRAGGEGAEQLRMGNIQVTDVGLWFNRNISFKGMGVINNNNQKNNFHLLKKITH